MTTQEIIAQINSVIAHLNGVKSDLRALEDEIRSSNAVSVKDIEDGIQECVPSFLRIAREGIVRIEDQL